MPINREFIGREYPPGTPYEVGREKIREFADALGDPHPAYRDAHAAKALGHPDVVAPPTFPIVLSMRATERVVGDPELSIDYDMVVHGEQSFSYSRPVYAGDVLTGRVLVENIRTAGSNDMLVTRCDLETPAGEHVCTAYSTLVVRGGAATDET